MNRRIHLNRPGDDIGVRLPGGVQPVAVHDNLTALHLIPGYPAILHLRGTGRQRGAPGVDKAAAVTGNARRAGNDHVGLLSSHLNVAVELARVACVHLVEDDFSLAFRQPRVGGHHSAEFG